MQNVEFIRQSVVKKINLLPIEKLMQVLTFIDFILSYSSSLNARPKPEAFLECAGSWSFEDDELNQILQDIDQSRQMELDNDYATTFMVGKEPVTGRNSPIL